MQAPVNPVQHRVRLPTRHLLPQVHLLRVAVVALLLAQQAPHHRALQLLMRVLVALLHQVLQLPVEVPVGLHQVLPLLMLVLVVLHPLVGLHRVLQLPMRVLVVPLPQVVHPPMQVLAQAPRQTVPLSAPLANLELLDLRLRFQATCQADSACALRLLPVRPVAPAPHPPPVDQPRLRLQALRPTQQASQLTLPLALPLPMAPLLAPTNLVALLPSLRRAPRLPVCSPCLWPLSLCRLVKRSVLLHSVLLS
jgi:hypothetical protein